MPVSEEEKASGISQQKKQKNNNRYPTQKLGYILVKRWYLTRRDSSSLFSKTKYRKRKGKNYIKQNDGEYQKKNCSSKQKV